MEKNLSFICLFLLLYTLCITSSLAQQIDTNQYLITLGTANTNGELSDNQKQALQSHLSDNYYYLLARFRETPNKANLITLSKSGIELLDFAGDKTYWTKISSSFSFQNLAFFGIESLNLPRPINKISPDIWENHFLLQSIEADVLIVGTMDKQKLVEKFGQIEITLLAHYEPFQIAQVRLSPSKLEELARLPFVVWIEKSDKKYTLNGSNPARELFRTGILENIHGLTGKNVKIGIWDGGSPGPHIDLVGRTTRSEASPQSSHATHVAGIMAGAGLVNPTLRGIATEATLFSYNINNPPPYENYIPFEMFRSIEEEQIVITQNSYGGVPMPVGSCITGAAYGLEGRSLDALVNIYPYLTHYFSVGNFRLSCAGTFSMNGGYRSTATGVTSAKNSITVGGINADNSLVSFTPNSSSWGPFADGRIAPHVVALGRDVASPDPFSGYQAFGWTGTSFASPIVSGIAALLYQKYRQLNSNQNPNAALIRGLICNGADDLGNPNLDYQYGFGKANALKSLKILNQGNIILGNVSQGNTQTYNAQINIPANTHRLKVMLTWNDPPAMPTTGIALVNNLNLSVTRDASAAIFNPWILDPLNPANPAVRGIDNINNVEQVTIDNPEAGNYTFQVTGASINVPVGGSQDFTLIWLIEPEYVEVTFPSGNEKLPPNSVEQIQWDAEGVEVNTFDLEYYDGANWNVIATNVAIAAGQPNIYNWTTPNIITDQAKVRVSAVKNAGGTATDESDAPFTIMGVPLGISSPPAITGIPSNNQITLQWQPVSGADSYDIYKIRQIGPWNGEAKYEFVENVPASVTSYVSKGLVNGMWHYHTVVARTNGGIISERAYATPILIPTGAGAATDIQALTLTSPATVCNDTYPITVKLRNKGLITLSAGTVIPVSYQINALPIVNESVTLTADLLANQELDYTFASVPALGGIGQYRVLINTSLVNDGVKDNNKIDTLINRNTDILPTPMSIEVSPSNNFCGTVTLTAKDFPIDSYTQSSITFAPANMSSATTATLGDETVLKLPIGFNFTFFDKIHTEFFLNSNGLIGFDAFDYDFITEVRRPIPNRLTPNQFIALAWTDLDPSAAGTVKYQVIGVAPFRKLVIEYMNVPYYSSAPPSPFRVSGQIMLYETTNVIEFHSINIQDTGGDKIMGIESSRGLRGIAAAGRNNTTWSVINEGLRFTPTNTSLVWNSGQTIPVITATESGNYSFRIIQNGCVYTTNTSISNTCDITKPQIIALSPLNNSTNIAPTTNLTITFNKQVRAGVGNIIIAGGATPVVIPISGGATGTVAFNGNIVTINPTTDLQTNTAYHILIDAGAIHDYSTPPNSFDGISTPTTWNFNTINTAPILDNASVLTLSLVNQNDTNPTGSLISDVFNPKISDSDPNPQKGIAVITTDNTNGVWQYSLNRGVSWTAVGTPTHSTALLLPDNAHIRFIPNPNFYGSSSFTFRAWDRTSGTVGGIADLSAPLSVGVSTAFSTAIGTANILINALPTLTPIANQSADEDTPISINFVINDLDDIATSLLTTAIATNTSVVSNTNITFTGTGANRALRIVPLPNQFGSTTIILTVSDGKANITTSFTLIVNPVNDPPTVVSFVKNTTSILSIHFSLADFNPAFSDIDNDVLSKIIILSLPMQGSLLLNNILVTANQEINASDISNLRYIPSPLFVGNTSFDWNASDGMAYALIPAKVSIGISLGNVPPTLSNISKTVIRNQAFAFSFVDFANAFADANNNSLTRIKITKLPNNGNLLLNNQLAVLNQEILPSQIPLLTYLPAKEYVGNDLFTWNASDGYVYANTSASVNLTVITGNKPPIVTNFEKQGIENQTIIFRQNDFASAYSDPDNNPLQKIQILSLPQKGILFLGKNPVNTNQEIFVLDIGNLSYVPTKDLSGADGFEWNASDNDNYAANTAFATIRVMPQVPTSPQKVTAQASSEKIWLTWAENPEANIAYYEIYMFTANSPQRLIGNSLNNSFLVSNLQNGLTYFFRIKAVTRSGSSSDFSETVQARPSIVLADNSLVVSNEVQVYPNPASKELILDINLEKPAIIYFTFIDLLGKIIEKGSSEKMEIKFIKSMDISKLAQGFYFLQIETGDAIIVKKIIKE